MKNMSKNQKYSINHEFEDHNDENECNINDEDNNFIKPLINETQSTRSKTSGDSNHNNFNTNSNNNFLKTFENIGHRER